MKRKKQILSLLLSLVTVLSVCCTCCYNNVDVYAEDESTVTKYGVVEGWTNDNLTSDDVAYNLFYPSTDSSFILFNDLILNDSLPNFTFYPSYRNENWVNYCFFTSSNIATFTSCIDTSFVLYNGTTVYLMCPQGDWRSNNGGGDFWSDSCYTYNTSSNSWTSMNGPRINDKNTGHSIDGVSYVTQEYWGGKIISCDIPIYYFTGDFPTSLDGLEQISGGSSIQGQTSSNNLVLESPDWIFKNNDYYAPYSDVINTGSVYPYGTIKFTFEPNDYQRLNPNEFTVTFSFTFDYDVNYKFTANSDNPPFYKNGLSNNWKTCSIKFIYNNDGSEYIDVPLSDFVNSGDSYSITFEEVMSHMEGSNYSLSNVLSISKEVTSLQYNKFNINCTAFISSGSSSSGYYTEWYNPINKKGYTTDKSAEVNNNPYYDSDSEYDDSFDDLFTPGTAGTGGDNSNNIGGGSSNSSSSSTGGSASASNGDIYINNVNNNNNSNNLSDGSSGFGKFLTTVLDLLSDGQKASSDTVLEMSDAHGFMDVANTTFSSVPVSLWTILLTTFSVCVAISIVAVVLGLLLKIFT